MRIRQPGPLAAVRQVAVPAGCVAIEAVLPAGGLLLDGLHKVLGGLDSACLTLTGGGFGPFAYVIPALSPDAGHAAFYSAVSRPAGVSRLECGAATVGFRDGAPFFHCHALWTEADGRRGCGHVLPDETVVAAPITVRGVGLAGARFVVRPDAETGFGLLTPEPTGRDWPEGAVPGVAVRLAPEEDLVTALEEMGAAAGFDRAVVAGGVGSTVGARFVEGRPIKGFATELLVRSGTIRLGGSSLDIAIVDLDGTIGSGMLARGTNPVLMTFEGVLVQA